MYIPSRVGWVGTHVGACVRMYERMHASVSTRPHTHIPHTPPHTFYKHSSGATSLSHTSKHPNPHSTTALGRERAAHRLPRHPSGGAADPDVWEFDERGAAAGLRVRVHVCAWMARCGCPFLIVWSRHWLVMEAKHPSHPCMHASIHHLTHPFSPPLQHNSFTLPDNPHDRFDFTLSDELIRASQARCFRFVIVHLLGGERWKEDVCVVYICVCCRGGGGEGLSLYNPLSNTPSPSHDHQNPNNIISHHPQHQQKLMAFESEPFGDKRVPVRCVCVDGPL